MTDEEFLIWGGISTANLKNIKTMMNNILRCILRVERDHNNIPMVSVNEMYGSLNLLQIEDIYRYTLLKFLHLVLYKNFVIFNEYYIPLLPSHRYTTRNRRQETACKKQPTKMFVHATRNIMQETTCKNVCKCNWK